MKTKYTFWELITDYRIEIPKIQRDYAQGRRIKEIEKIADKFLSDLCNSIVKNKELNLDFVYGKVGDDILTPLDGQQRLTTLFLIHWYLALKENKLTDEIKSLLLKFSYETRISSQDFCQKLVNENINYSSISEKLSDIIIDSKWYFLSWELDPTVSSMLNMLDNIHCKFKDIDEDIFLQLSEKKIITFQFLPLEKFKLTDELYIKMNARGKPLSEFENFKANFAGYLKSINQKTKLDNEWLDIFWNSEKDNKDIQPDNVDEIFFNFFKNITINFYVENNDIDKEFVDNYQLFDIYDNVYENENYINKITAILDSLTTFEDIENIFSNFLKSHGSINYWERLRFYAISLFFSKFGIVTDDNNMIFDKWLRVTKNLINNTLIQSTTNYKDAIRSLNELSDNIESIYQHISSSSETIKYFTGLQRKEESLKADLILSDGDWENLLIEIEQHSYFDGQIGFILEYSKNEDNNYDKSSFKEYSQILYKLFSKEFQENYDFLFQRALLAKGDYLVDIGQNKTFCVFDDALRTKMDNWRKVFNDKKKTTYLHELLDELRNGELLENLKTTINKNQITDWRKYIIDNSEYISYCKHRLIRKYTEENIYLLSKTQMNGRHIELYSWDLFANEFEKLTFNPFSNIWYFESTSWDEPCIVIENFKYKENSFAIDITYNQDSNYYMKFYDKNSVEIPEILKTLLTEINFTDRKIILSKDELKPKIKDLCRKIEEIKE